MPLTLVSRDRTRPVRFDENISHAIVVENCRVDEFLHVEEFFDDPISTKLYEMVL
jgi:hypothetical protein